MMNPLGSLNNFVFNGNDIKTDSPNPPKTQNSEVKDSKDSNISSKPSINRDRDTDTETDYSKNKFEDDLQNEQASLRPKDSKKTNTFKDKLEDVNSAVDLLLMSLQIVSTVPVDELETPTNFTINLEIDPNANSATLDNHILTTLGDKLSNQTESLIKDIANIDLDSDDAIQDILKLSDTLEQLNSLQAKVEELVKKLDIQVDVDTDNKPSEPELELLIDDKLEKFISKYLEETPSTNKSTDSRTEHSITDDGSVEIVEATATEESQSDTSSDTNSSSDPDRNNFMLSGANSKNDIAATTESKTAPIQETVNVNKLTKFLYDRIVKIDSGKREEILMKLTPGDMGEVKLSIARQGDKLEIKMEFSNQDSMDSVEHRLNELQTSLRAKGFDTEIKVSSTESSDLNSNQQQQQNSSNEAKDEQKEKYLHTMPSWLRDKESHNKTSFQDALGGILE